MESRLRQIRIAKPSSPVWLVTEAFVTKWNQRIPKIRRWQFMCSPREVVIKIKFILSVRPFPLLWP